MINWEGDKKTGSIGMVDGVPSKLWWIERCERYRGPDRFFLRYWSPAGMEWDYIDDFQTHRECRQSAQQMAEM